MPRFMKARLSIIIVTAMFVAIGCNKQDDKDVRVTTYTVVVAEEVGTTIHG